MILIIPRFSSTLFRYPILGNQNNMQIHGAGSSATLCIRSRSSIWSGGPTSCIDEEHKIQKSGSGNGMVIRFSTGFS